MHVGSSNKWHFIKCGNCNQEDLYRKIVASRLFLYTLLARICGNRTIASSALMCVCVCATQGWQLVSQRQPSQHVYRNNARQRACNAKEQEWKCRSGEGDRKRRKKSRISLELYVMHWQLITRYKYITSPRLERCMNTRSICKLTYL